MRGGQARQLALAPRGALPYTTALRAEVAQLVEHNLAKVGVAGSSPVFRSIASKESRPIERRLFLSGEAQPLATWPSGKAEACKAFITGSNPVVASRNAKRLGRSRAAALSSFLWLPSS